MIERRRNVQDRLLINDVAPVRVFRHSVRGKKAGSKMALLFLFNISVLLAGGLPYFLMSIFLDRMSPSFLYIQYIRTLRTRFKAGKKK